MNKIYYLSTCNTCTRIMNEIGHDFFDERLDIKETMPSESELGEAANQLGSFKAIFNTRARKLRELAADEKPQNDEDYLKFILTDYTYLRRPFFVISGNYLAGNSKKIIDQVKSNL